MLLTFEAGEEQSFLIGLPIIIGVFEEDTC